MMANVLCFMTSRLTDRIFCNHNALSVTTCMKQPTNHQLSSSEKSIASSRHEALFCYGTWIAFVCLLWSPYVIGRPYIFSSCSFFPSSSSFFSSPNLSGRRLDVYHTSTHGVALVRIQNACLKYAVRGSLQIQDAKKSLKIAIWAPSHNFVGLYLCK